VTVKLLNCAFIYDGSRIMSDALSAEDVDLLSLVKYREHIQTSETWR
jgi:hypothetical protein